MPVWATQRAAIVNSTIVRTNFARMHCSSSIDFDWRFYPGANGLRRAPAAAPADGASPRGRTIEVRRARSLELRDGISPPQLHLHGLRNLQWRPRTGRGGPP